ncbi:uncharacterized protein LOC119639917 [Glossina fuscipes]|uniref:Uncharacterized protein LOC119639917 n=1 Tax=Glossina fuscipes TaxID=7396 RepID=A0A9C6DVU3_9MUSC|nr:uncharacterized protein LOC119639917 [Glossina fuscipes]
MRRGQFERSSIGKPRCSTMVSTGALIVVAALHVLLSLSFFIEQEADQCSTAPTIASWIFLIGLFDILWDMCIFPPRYAHLPSICRIIWEIIFAILITEFGTIIVWCQIEKLCCRLTKFMLLIMGLYPYVFYTYEAYILGIVTSAISLAFVICASKATGNFYFLLRRGECAALEIRERAKNLTKIFRKVKRTQTKKTNTKGRITRKVRFNDTVSCSPEDE